MDIVELTEKLKEAYKNTTHVENVELLNEADIINDSGYYAEKNFSKETIEHDKKFGKPII